MFIVILVVLAIVILGVFLITRAIKKANKKVEINSLQKNSQDKKECKKLRESLAINAEVIKVLEIEDNIAALSKCATLFEKDIINKAELEELEEYIKSRV